MFNHNYWNYKVENEFFKENKPENWTYINFLNYKYIQTSVLFTNKERRENSYYSTFLEFYKEINSELAESLKTDFRVNNILFLFLYYCLYRFIL